MLVRNGGINMETPAALSVQNDIDLRIDSHFGELLTIAWRHQAFFRCGGSKSNTKHFFIRRTSTTTINYTLAAIINYYHTSPKFTWPKLQWLKLLFVYLISRLYSLKICENFSPWKRKADWVFCCVRCRFEVNLNWSVRFFGLKLVLLQFCNTAFECFFLVFSLLFQKKFCKKAIDLSALNARYITHSHLFLRAEFQQKEKRFVSFCFGWRKCERAR